MILWSCLKRRSVRVAERLALPTSDHGVAGSNPAGGEILPEPKRRFIAQSLSCSPFHRLEMTEILLKGRKTLIHPSYLKRFSRHFVDKVLYGFNDPSSSLSLDSLLTILLYYTKCRTRKSQITQPNIYRILSKVNQVVYTLDTACMPNACIMILSQAVHVSWSYLKRFSKYFVDKVLYG